MTGTGPVASATAGEPAASGSAGAPRAPVTAGTLEAPSSGASLLPPPAPAPSLPAAVLRLSMAIVSRRCFDPRLTWPVQRSRLRAAGRLLPLPRLARTTTATLGGVPVEVVTAAGGRVPVPAGRPGGVSAGEAGLAGAVRDAAGVSSATAGWPRTLVHFHGGGYCVGGPFVARSFAVHLAALTGAAVVLPDYRLAPEHPAPAALHDALAVLRALDAVVPGPVVLSGDSAGAGLALAAAQRRRDLGEPLPAGLLLHCPWLDLTADTAPVGAPGRAGDPSLVRRDVVLRPSWLTACARAYAPDGADDPVVSPLLGSIDGLPPMVVQAAADDLLRTDAERLALMAAASGADLQLVLAPGMWHDFAMQAGLVAAAGSAVRQAADAALAWWAPRAPEAPGG